LKANRQQQTQTKKRSHAAFLDTPSIIEPNFITDHSSPCIQIDNKQYGLRKRVIQTTSVFEVDWLKRMLLPGGAIGVRADPHSYFVQYEKSARGLASMERALRFLRGKSQIGGNSSIFKDRPHEIYTVVDLK
jgi:hypothetical protein